MKNDQNKLKSGFVIANQREEFLVHYEKRPGCTVKTWAKSPSLAQVFPSSSKCRKVMRSISDSANNLWELSFIETDQKYLIGCSGTVPPPWF